MAVTPKKPAARKPRTPARPSGLAHGRWLGDFPDLSAAELRLVDCCARGEVWKQEGWDWKRPTEKSDANIIRADLIRFLALGGDAENPVHEEGVMACGAWITGHLNLHQCTTTFRLALRQCNFESQLTLVAAQLPELVLDGSLVPGVRASGLKVHGNIFLRNEFSATGEVVLLGAEIGGNLSCSASSFSNLGGKSLSGDGIKVVNDVFLTNDFAAKGEVRLLGAEIGGNLICTGGSFANERGYALSADGIKVAESIFLRGAIVKGAILFSAARIGELIDDDFDWQAGGHLLNGLRYDRIIGPTDAASRIAWLKRQRPDQLDARDWTPQPWEQLIKVLREMGHPGAAAEVAMEKQRMMRAAGQIGTRVPNTRLAWTWRRWLDARWTPVSNALARGFHDFYGWIAGYGYRPTRIAGRMALVWLICAGLYWASADQYGAFGPADPVIASPTLYPDADKLCGHGNEPGTARWTECPGVPDEYSTFQPLIYSLDVILPLIDLQQESDWAPIAEGPTGRDLPMGVFVRWVMWFEILFGWVASLMFVAIVSRLVDKD